HIDDHHTVEDTGIALGQALTQAVGDKKGIQRYGSCLLPMDDALVRCALDLSARPYLVWGLDLPTERIGAFDIELLREFFQAFSTHGGVRWILGARPDSPQPKGRSSRHDHSDRRLRQRQSALGP
ncbi:MAG: imidazoleglycerol-phosphate dehydratase, partial [Rhodobacterales bacterium]